MRGGLLAFSGDDSFSIRAIPHKERTAKMSEKRYNKEVKKQLTMSLISDELGAIGSICKHAWRRMDTSIGSLLSMLKGDFNE